MYGFSEGPGEDALALCGERGSGLMRMRGLGLPVPESFLISEACTPYIGSGELPENLMVEAEDHLACSACPEPDAAQATLRDRSTARQPA